MEYVQLLLLIIIYFSVFITNCSQTQIPIEEHLNFTALGHKYGHTVKEYDVVTSDGYILKLFHVAGDKNRPVLLMHGVVDSADTFIVRGKDSMVITLADRGYDVWAGNARGNKYSRRHLTLDPDVNKQFWDFSFHEIGYYDLPALIDFILNKTGQRSISAIGHSQGNTIFYVLGSTRPDYNEKIEVLIALSPVCFFVQPKPFINTVITLSPLMTSVLQLFGQEEIFGDASSLNILGKIICSQKNIGYVICGHGFIFFLGGSDPEELEPEFFSFLMAYYPTGTSVKNMIHVSQNAASNSFSQFDYGVSRNIDVHNSVQPSKYNLGEVKMRVAILFGENDSIASLQDVELLRKSLPNVVEYHLIEHKRFNHVDAIWGRNMRNYLFPRVLNILEKYPCKPNQSFINSCQIFSFCKKNAL